MRNLTELYRMDLPHRAISVYIYLSDRAGKKNICWPSIPTISKDLKLSESTTRRALNPDRTAPSREWWKQQFAISIGIIGKASEFQLGCNDFQHFLI